MILAPWYVTVVCSFALSSWTPRAIKIRGVTPPGKGQRTSTSIPGIHHGVTGNEHGPSLSRQEGRLPDPQERNTPQGKGSRIYPQRVCSRKDMSNLKEWLYDECHAGRELCRRRSKSRSTQAVAGVRTMYQVTGIELHE